MAKTLLLADDSVTIQKVVSISFASEDVTLVTVDNGDDAVERAKETRPDLILADVVMPGKSGYEVCEAIKADPELRHIPVLLLSGTFEAFDEERAARVGAAGHVAKPFEARTLVAQVNRLLAAAPPPAAVARPAAFAPPEAATVAAMLDAPDLEGFDFFDDDLAELIPAGDRDSVARTTTDDGESGFAFGDDELSGDEGVAATAEPPASLRPAAAASAGAKWERSEPFSDRTIAILPDENRASKSAAVSPTAPADDEWGIDLRNPGDELHATSDSELEDSLLSSDASATSDEAFDFSFERESTAPEAVPIETTLYADVVYGDADDLVAGAVFDTHAAVELDVEEGAFVDDAAAPEATRFLVDAPGFRRPLASAEIVEADLGFDVEDGLEPEPAGLRPPAAAPAARRNDADTRRPLPDASAARAEVVLAEIAPQFGAALHETLERIAWESFGEATEKIVREVVDRVEQIAWEVIPQLTETLIKAEIRRLKGEDDD